MGHGHRLTPLWALKAVFCLSSGSSSPWIKMFPVFFHWLGLQNNQIGYLLMVRLVAEFPANIFWAAVSDCTGDFKRVLVLSHVAGLLVMCCLLLPAVQSAYGLVAVTMALGPFLLGSRISVVDAMTLAIVEEYEEAAKAAPLEADGGGSGGAKGRGAPVLPSYSEQRLWGAVGWSVSAFFTGYLIDLFGVVAIFAMFAVCLLLMLGVLVTQMPAGHASPHELPEVDTSAGLCGALLRFETVWFFANLFAYGVHMALVESFLYVYLLRDFAGTTKALLGATSAVMGVFELPVFFYVDSLFRRWDLRAVLVACHGILAARMLLYAALPEDLPGLVLLVEPLHGITFAAMWSCSVEYAKRLSPRHARAKMQAVTSGVYYKLAIASGSALWGELTMPPPRGFGFRPMYRAAAGSVLLWSGLWIAGWAALARGGGGQRCLAAPPAPAAPASAGEASLLSDERAARTS